MEQQLTAYLLNNESPSAITSPEKSSVIYWHENS